MNESFLYYIWQFQYYNTRELLTTAGERIYVVKPGLLNHNSGPDFTNATVSIEGMSWSGTVEIHTRSSDWKQHSHHLDPAYENVILHVVWEDDAQVTRMDGSAVPTLILRDRIAPELIADYRRLIHNPFSIPCTLSFPDVSPIVKHSMIDRAMMQRLENKSDAIETLLTSNNNDWEETCWQWLAFSFGFKLNSDACLAMAKSVSYKTLIRHSDKSLHLEALLFGQAGFLQVTAGDAYYFTLQREYDLLAHKYGLREKALSKTQWKFLRLRPSNFPTVRIAQLAALIGEKKNFSSQLLELRSVDEAIKFFSSRQSSYWETHYRFNKPAKGKVAPLGGQSAINLVGNVVAPLLVAWGRMNDDPMFLERAGEMLRALPAEDNVILREWKSLGCTPENAFDAQGLIELYNNFCRRRNCLTCVIGASILKPVS